MIAQKACRTTTCIGRRRCFARRSRDQRMAQLVPMSVRGEHVQAFAQRLLYGLLDILQVLDPVAAGDHLKGRGVWSVSVATEGINGDRSRVCSHSPHQLIGNMNGSGKPRMSESRTVYGTSTDSDATCARKRSTRLTKKYTNRLWWWIHPRTCRRGLADRNTTCPSSQ